jgi:hypothetical protein
MGMGYGANFAEVVEQDFVQEQCPKAFRMFFTALDKEEDETLQTFAIKVGQGEEDETGVWKAYYALLRDFQKKTKLKLSIGYHDSKNDGDRYDDVNGVFWFLDFDSVYKRTSAAKKFADKITLKFYVTFG